MHEPCLRLFRNVSRNGRMVNYLFDLFLWFFFLFRNYIYIYIYSSLKRVENCVQTIKMTWTMTKGKVCSLFASNRVLKRYSFSFFFLLQISMVIHYALMEGNNTIACFEVPAKITNWWECLVFFFVEKKRWTCLPRYKKVYVQRKMEGSVRMGKKI